MHNKTSLGKAKFFGMQLDLIAFNISSFQDNLALSFEGERIQVRFDLETVARWHNVVG
jgi:hypothetical protein